MLLPEGGDPVTVAEAINSPSPLRPIPYGLETGNPVGAKILIEERPEGATMQWVLANPDRPLSRLYRYLVLTYPQATDIGGVRAALQGIGEVQHVEPNYALELHAAVSPTDPLLGVPGQAVNTSQWGTLALRLPEAWEWSKGHL